MEWFSDLLDSYLRDLADLKVVVWSYDEVLASKANKSALVVIREEFERKYIQIERWTEVQKSFKEL